MRPQKWLLVRTVTHHEVHDGLGLKEHTEDRISETATIAQTSDLQDNTCSTNCTSSLPGPGPEALGKFRDLSELLRCFWAELWVGSESGLDLG